MKALVTRINPKTLVQGYEPPKIELARASQDEKKDQLKNVVVFQQEHESQAEVELAHLQKTALSGGNIFEALLRASRHCSLYQMSKALYEVGGQYRRNL